MPTKQNQTGGSENELAMSWEVDDNEKAHSDAVEAKVIELSVPSRLLTGRRNVRILRL